MKLKIMTYNIQHGIHHLSLLASSKPRKERFTDPSLIKLDLIAEAIKSIDPDILSLNEVRGQTPPNQEPDPYYFDQTGYLANALGFPGHIFAPALMMAGGPYGNAQLSRFAYDSAENIPIPDPKVKDEPTYYETRCLIKTRLHFTEQDGTQKHLTVLNTHFGLAKAEQRNAVQTILENTDPSEPTILMGDFNVLPDDPVLSPIKELYTDSQILLPEGICTFPSPKPESKIDYIFACGKVKFLSASVPELVVSDHRPVVAKIEF